MERKTATIIKDKGAEFGARMASKRWDVVVQPRMFVSTVAIITRESSLPPLLRAFEHGGHVPNAYSSTIHYFKNYPHSSLQKLIIFEILSFVAK